MLRDLPGGDGGKIQRGIESSSTAWTVLLLFCAPRGVMVTLAKKM